MTSHLLVANRGLVRSQSIVAGGSSVIGVAQSSESSRSRGTGILQWWRRHTCQHLYRKICRPCRRSTMSWTSFQTTNLSTAIGSAQSTRSSRRSRTGQAPRLRIWWRHQSHEYRKRGRVGPCFWLTAIFSQSLQRPNFQLSYELFHYLFIKNLIYA